MTTSPPGAIEQQIVEIIEDIKAYEAELKSGKNAEAYVDVHEGTSEQIAEILEGVDEAAREEALRRVQAAWQGCRSALEAMS